MLFYDYTKHFLALIMCHNGPHSGYLIVSQSIATSFMDHNKSALKKNFNLWLTYCQTKKKKKKNQKKAIMIKA